MKKLYGLENSAGEILFTYRTNQGNVKKAFFSSEKKAEEALSRYIEDGYGTKGELWTLIELGKLWSGK